MASRINKYKRCVRERFQAMLKNDPSGNISLVKAVAGFDEEVELLVGIVNHVCMQLHSMVHPKWTCKQHKDGR